MSMTGRWSRRRGAGLAVGLVLFVTTACSEDPESSPPDTTVAERPERPQTREATPAPTEPPTSTVPEDQADRVLSGDESFPDGFTVPAGEVWELDPAATTTVASGANVVVEGILRMRPDNPDITHTLQFVGVDESAFVGGGMEVLPTDVGLWVTGAGQLDIVGSPKAGWNRTGADPTWRPDDDIRVAPTEADDTSSFAAFEPDSPVPTVSYAEESYAAEVFNLTRNVRIEGTGDGEANPANGRAHIWINSTEPQTIRYAELAHLGPRQADDGRDPTEGVHGRYPLHFHMSEDGSRGSLVEGVVVRDAGNHAFVPHKSHGITIRDTIAFNVFEDAYWWDPNMTDDGESVDNATDDLVIEHALAALVRSDPEFRGYRLSGFVLGVGENATITDSVAVGVQGNVSASGFHWPESANGAEHNVWTFHDNVAHNNNVDGIFVWQNDSNNHVIERFVGYRNGQFGVDHGAYNNNYTYDGLILFENGHAGIMSKAAARRAQRWTNVVTDGIVIGERSVSSDDPVVFEGLTLDGKIVVEEEAEPSAYEFRDARTAGGGEVGPDSFEIRQQLSEIRVYRGDGSSFAL